jgi:hypothetical protein
MGLPVMTIQGDVVAAHSYWTDDGSRIVTESTVRTPDGDVVVSQLGGSVDGIGMRSMPSPAILELGMTVAVTAHHAVDLEQTDHVVLDSVMVMGAMGVMGDAPAFVRTGPTKAGHYLYWESGCIFVTIDAAGTTAIPGDAEFPVIDASIATWNTDTHTPSCSYMQVMSQGRKSLKVGNDHVNLIKFRDPPDVWGRPASGKDPAMMYPSAAAGITTAVYIDDSTSARDGAILDADIEINGVDFDITIDPDPTNFRNAVLQNTLTHELGHLHGLEHTCRAPDDPPRKDNLGNDVPYCTDMSLPPSITEATMYPYQDSGETTKETLSDDDIQAICEIYPVASDPGTCAPVPPIASGGCCSASGPFDRPDVGLLLSGMTFAIVMRRRRPSRKP